MTQSVINKEAVVKIETPFDFPLPERMLRTIAEMREEIKNHPYNHDLYQDELRSDAHGYTDLFFTEEQAEAIIDYYCRKGNL